MTAAATTPVSPNSNSWGAQLSSWTNSASARLKPMIETVKQFFLKLWDHLVKGFQVVKEAFAKYGNQFVAYAKGNPLPTAIGALAVGGAALLAASYCSPKDAAPAAK